MKGYFKADPVEFKSFDPVDIHAQRRNRLLVFVCFTLLWTSFIFPRHPISGSSMNPTYVNGQQAFCIRQPFGNFNKGDVVIAYPGTGYLVIKRVAAGPGDTIAIHPDGSVTVNGELYAYGVGSAYEGGSFEGLIPNEDGSYSATLKDGEYYLLGDNRENSADSRYYGIFKRSDIEEKLLFVI